MNKDYLEAWNFIKDQMQNFTFSHLVVEMVKNADIVEQTLHRLEQIDNASPNEDLEILLKARQVCDVSCIEMCNNCQKRSAYNSIKTTLLKAQEQEKENAELKAKAQEQDRVLKIIKEKNVDIEYIKTCFYDLKGGLKEYNAYVGHDEDRELTQEEFDLLKKYCDKEYRSE